jgi:hypothetical protein
MTERSLRSHVSGERVSLSPVRFHTLLKSLRALFDFLADAQDLFASRRSMQKIQRLCREGMSEGKVVG